MIEVNSFDEFRKAINEKGKAYLLIFKEGSEKSNCAYRNIAAAAADIKDVSIYYANVIKTLDIHGRFNITSVPSLLEFEKGRLKNLIKGCNDMNYFKALFEGTIYLADAKSGETRQKRVTVYSTPACSWCNTLKSYLKMHSIRYTEIDVSRDHRLADELVKRSGQMGVPQTDINGEIIVGFNKLRINELLNIQG